MSKYTNDEKVAKYNLRKILRYVIILFAIATIVTSVLCLFRIVIIWVPIGLYVITFVLKIVFTKNDFHEEEGENKDEKRKNSKK